MTVVQTFERMDHQRLTNERMLVLAVVLGGGGFDVARTCPRGDPEEEEAERWQGVLCLGRCIAGQ